MGSGGGGGSSGKVEYPAYMSFFHSYMLGQPFVVGQSVSPYALNTAMETAMAGASPYASFVGINTTDVLLGNGNLITDFTAPFSYLTNYAGLDFDTLIAFYRTSTDLSSFITTANSKIDTLTAAQSDILEDDLNQVVIPKFKAGYRTANAVMSSAFVIGEAIIRGGKTKEVTKTDAALRYEAFKILADLTIKNETLTLEYATKRILSKRDIATTALDFHKIYAGLKSELDDTTIEMSAKDKLWDLKVFQYGGNFLGSISGSAVQTGGNLEGKNKASSALGGAIGGASIGASFGPWGAVIGGVAGGIAGLLG